MDKRSVRRPARYSSISIVAVALFNLSSATVTYADPYPLSKPAALSETDLRVIAQLQGINYQRFDVEIDKAFCIRISVAVAAEGKTDPMSPWEHCSLAGLHRLMVALRTIDDHSAVVRTALHDSSGMGGTTGNGPIAVPATGWSMGHPQGPNGGPPALSEGEQTVIATFEYGRRGDHRVGIRVHAELFPNPAGTIGATAPLTIIKRD